MGKIGHLIQTMGPFVLIPALFVVVGVGSWLNILWGLVTGGPRALQESGAPYLFDRPYYLMGLLAVAGWTIALLSALAEVGNPLMFEGFLTGWSLLAIGVGLLFLLRLDMRLRGTRYLAEHGFWLFRPFHAMQVRQFNRQTWVIKIVPWIFLVIGACTLIFSLTHITEAWRQTAAGARVLVGYLTP